MREMLVAMPEDLTELAGRVLAEVSRPPAMRAGGTALALHGELGSGKTAFVQHLARVLGVTEQVTSPTFVIMRFYPIKTHDFFKTLVHVDAYRIESDAEMEVIGFEHVLRGPTNLVCVEWAEKITDALPEDALHITLMPSTVSESGTGRTVAYGYKNENTHENRHT